MSYGKKRRRRRPLIPENANSLVGCQDKLFGKRGTPKKSATQRQANQRYYPAPQPVSLYEPSTWRW